MSPTEKPEEFRQIDEVWGLHDLARTLADPPPGGVGCVAFVVDERYIPADFDPQVELRLAASFGDNPYPATRSRGFCEPEPTSEKLRFGVHIIGIRGKRMAVFDMWYTDQSRRRLRVRRRRRACGPARSLPGSPMRSTSGP